VSHLFHNNSCRLKPYGIKPLECGHNKLIQDVDKYSSIDTASHPRRH